MSGKYAPIPSAREAADAERQMEDAFDASDDEDGDRTSETRPMMATSGSTSNHHNNIQTNSNLYNFEFDYTMPPPGSPPRPSARALPNNIFGNSNGYVPDTTIP